MDPVAATLTLVTVTLVPAGVWAYYGRFKEDPPRPRIALAAGVVTAVAATVMVVLVGQTGTAVMHLIEAPDQLIVDLSQTGCLFEQSEAAAAITAYDTVETDILEDVFVVALVFFGVLILTPTVCGVWCVYKWWSRSRAAMVAVGMFTITVVGVGTTAVWTTDICEGPMTVTTLPATLRYLFYACPAAESCDNLAETLFGSDVFAILRSPECEPGERVSRYFTQGALAEEWNTLAETMCEGVVGASWATLAAAVCTLLLIMVPQRVDYNEHRSIKDAATPPITANRPRREGKRARVPSHLTDSFASSKSSRPSSA